jgi:GTP-binding protein
MTRANAKVGAYPFTTLSPQLGIAELDAERRLVVADLPGLIEGAAQGAGLGHDFLKHVERTRAIVHLVDLAPLDGSDPAQNWRTIRGELHEFSPELADKPELVVLNKLDLVAPEERAARIQRFAGAIGLAKGEAPVSISGATGDGVRAMLEAAWALAGRREVVRWSGSAAEPAR